MVSNAPDDSLPKPPDTSHLITDDETPVDSFFADKQLRMLGDALNLWKHPTGRRFLVGIDVGVFPVPKNPALVPDVLVAFDVDLPTVDGEPLRSYFLWEFGKPPDIVLELVSRSDGGELTQKLRAYEKLRVPFYIVFDPLETLSSTPVRVFASHQGELVEQQSSAMRPFGLDVTRWRGSYEGYEAVYLRWCDLDGRFLPLGVEEAKRANDEAKRADDEAKRAHDEAKRAHDEAKRADDEAKRADNAVAHAKHFADRLRALGVDPEDSG